MKTVLIQPPVPQSEDEALLGVYPPVGLAWLAGNIQDHVEVLDLRRHPLTIEQWDLVGISCQTVSLKNCARTAQKIRDELPEAVIVTGGHHPVPQDLLPFSDCVVRGEGEITFKELFSHVKKGKNFKHIPGVVSDKGWAPERPPTNITALDYPAYDCVPLAEYHPNEGTMVTSRGCPYTCVFCTRPFGRTWRGRTPSQVLKEAETLIHKGAEILHIMDDLFTYDRARVLDICQKFRSLSVLWDLPNGTRVDTVDQDMVAAMADSGCYKILYGIESGVPHILKNMKKHITLNQIKRAVSMTKEAGIEVEGLFMVGNPGDTPETIKKTVEFIKGLDMKAHFSLATPYPGTDFWTWVETHGAFLGTPYEEFEQVPVFETADFSAGDRLHMVKWASVECR